MEKGGAFSEALAKVLLAIARILTLDPLHPGRRPMPIAFSI